MTSRRRIALRALFAAVLLSLPLMIVVRESVGEPYPGLYQPAFDGSTMRGDLFGRDEAVVMVRDAAGERHRIAVTDLLDVPELERGYLLSATRSALRDPRRMRTPEAVAYVRERAAELGIDSPVRLRVTWYSTTRGPRERDGAERGVVVQAYSVRLAP
ncbi:hypothetical protein [Aeromicrobium stalagmiti]|uniref:hypothetical protein n=1 Tax=Aeromicrobium stalagmiti TaxID=2738988 RepID=UPI001568A205|nr:hypothetical protein [Aeromicrobium stalagmiti]NRQ49912.1 hypothetical protein [Aeromicrobium stalagmiti]